ncbi:MAG: acetylxylan esterase, partial [Verrucomicrobia bacterium]|nr:acetylxylan esterase [Verrucomicrobiota bacterium]
MNVNLAVLALSVVLYGADPPPTPTPGDRLLANYFQTETANLSARCLADIRTLADWKAKRGEYQRELREMLGLDPLPPRTDLHPVITGKIDSDTFTVQNLHFQSMPGLYVTGNLYLPKNLTRPAPTVLYVCGHALVMQHGISYGNKTAYQHHGEWFARNGYVCLVIDSLQLGEIQGIHHGTYRRGMWWWNSRGYTPAGVEAWNGIRALDYLQSRPEVDSNRFGITGRSGGGAYSWTIAALDNRIKVAAPVAGITDLHNHVVDGTVEGHCDCMFFVNTYRWDYPQLAALLAPRPLLICNSDKDSIFPLDGVMRLHAKVRQIYSLYGASTNLGVLITEGPHQDTQDLQVPVFRWFNRHLKGQDPIIAMPATNFFQPEQLRVFSQLPANARNTNIQETFVPLAHPPSAEPSSADRARLLTLLRQKTFRAWPTDPGPITLTRAFSVTHRGVVFQAYDFSSQPAVPLRLYLLSHAGRRTAKEVTLDVLDQVDWSDWLAALAPRFAPQLTAELGIGTPPRTAKSRFAGQLAVVRRGARVCAFIAPRGIGLTAWTADPRERIQIRRRFMLLGETLDSMRVWDIRRAVQALRAIPATKNARLELHGRGPMAVNVLYAALFEPTVATLDLPGLPASQRDGPDYLNVQRVLDLPQALSLFHGGVRSRHLTSPPSGEPNVK